MNSFRVYCKNLIEIRAGNMNSSIAFGRNVSKNPRHHIGSLKWPNCIP